jgi:hypothetical protein
MPVYNFFWQLQLRPASRMATSRKAIVGRFFMPGSSYPSATSPVHPPPPVCCSNSSSPRSKRAAASPQYTDICSLSGKCHPGLEPVTDQRSIACHPGLRSGISSFKRYLRPCPTADVLFILAKRSKTSVTNIVTGMYFMVSRSSNLPAQLLALGIRQDM